MEVREELGFTGENFIYLPVRESSLPLTGSSLVFGLDDHDSSLCGTELQHRLLSDSLSPLPLTCIE